MTAWRYDIYLTSIVTIDMTFILPPWLQLLPLQHSISHSNTVHCFEALSDPAIIAQAAFSSKRNNIEIKL